MEGNVTRLASTGSQSWIDDYLSYLTTGGCCNYDNATLKPCGLLTGKKFKTISSRFFKAGEMIALHFIHDKLMHNSKGVDMNDDFH